MEIMNVDTMNKEEDIYLSLLYNALKNDLSFIEEEMEEKAPKDYSAEQNGFKKVWGNGIVNPIKRSFVRNLSEDKKKAMDNLDAFEEKYGKKYDLEKDILKMNISDYFKEDSLSEARIMMSLRLSLEDEYAFLNKDEVLSKDSELLFDDPDKSGLLYETLKNNYYKISKEDLRNIEKNVLVGLGIVTAATILAGPIGLTAASFTAKGSAALGAAASMGAGVYGATVAKITGAVVAAEILLTGATCGVFTAVEIKKNKELRNEFRNISSDSLALKFAVKATLISELKKMGTDKMTEYLDDALEVLDNYRADSEYMMIVEKLDANNAKKKISCCNSFADVLEEIVGI